MVKEGVNLLFLRNKYHIVSSSRLVDCRTDTACTAKEKSLFWLSVIKRVLMAQNRSRSRIFSLIRAAEQHKKSMAIISHLNNFAFVKSILLSATVWYQDEHAKKRKRKASSLLR